MQTIEYILKIAIKCRSNLCVVNEVLGCSFTLFTDLCSIYFAMGFRIGKIPLCANLARTIKTSDISYFCYSC